MLVIKNALFIVPVFRGSQDFIGDITHNDCNAILCVINTI